MLPSKVTKRYCKARDMLTKGDIVQGTHCPRVQKSPDGRSGTSNSGIHRPPCWDVENILFAPPPSHFVPPPLMYLNVSPWQHKTLLPPPHPPPGPLHHIKKCYLTLRKRDLFTPCCRMAKNMECSCSVFSPVDTKILSEETNKMSKSQQLIDTT